MSWSTYSVKKVLLAPRTRWYRRRERDLDQFSRHALELHYYRRPMYEFMRAHAADPDLLHPCDVDTDGVVLDVGAYDGSWSEAVLERCGPRIYAFEPDPFSFRRLRERLGHDRRVTLFEVGLGARDERATMALDALGSSVSSEPGMFGRAEVQLRDVVAVLDELALERVDLLKVNIEGGEYELFDRLIETGWLLRVERVLVQFHEWLPRAHRRRRAIRRVLRRTHDEVWDYPFVWELWQRSDSK